MGIQVLPPDVNQSEMFFTVVPAVAAAVADSAGATGSGGAGAEEADIRFGLAALKNVGEGAVEAVLQARREGGRFRSLFDFCDRVDLRAVNRRVIESFVKSGTFDSTDAAARGAVRGASTARRRAARSASATATPGRRACSAAGEAARSPEATAEPVADAPPWSEAERLAFEKESLGFFISGHPLERFREELAQWASATTGTLAQQAASAR